MILIPKDHRKTKTRIIWELANELGEICMRDVMNVLGVSNVAASKYLYEARIRGFVEITGVITFERGYKYSRSYLYKYKATEIGPPEYGYFARSRGKTFAIYDFILNNEWCQTRKIMDELGEEYRYGNLIRILNNLVSKGVLIERRVNNKREFKVVKRTVGEHNGRNLEILESDTSIT